MSVRSPSGVSPPARVSTDFDTGRLSPVSADSATSSVAARKSQPSAGTTSPASIRTTSPGTSCSAGTCVSFASRRTRALTIIICCSAPTASAALPSWRRPSTALKRVRKTITRPVPSSCSGQMLPSPATSSTICIGSRYWRTKARQRGSDFASANLFGPWRSRRAAASSAERPRAAWTPRERATSGPGRTYHGRSPAGACTVLGAACVVATAPPRSAHPDPLEPAPSHCHLPPAPAEQHHPERTND